MQQLTQNNAMLQCLCFLRNAVILRKISKIGATRCQILRLKCAKFDFRRWGCAPDPAGGAYSGPQTLQLYLKGLLLTGGRGEGSGAEGGGRGR